MVHNNKQNDYLARMIYKTLQLNIRHILINLCIHQNNNLDYICHQNLEQEELMFLWIDGCFLIKK